MNNTPLLILFTTAIFISALAVTVITFKSSEQMNETSSVLGIVSQRVSRVFQVVSAYTDGTKTYFLVSGYSGEIPLHALTAVVDGAPYDVNVTFVKDTDGDDLLDPSDVAYITMDVSLSGEHEVTFVSQPVSIPMGEISIDEKPFRYRRVVSVSNGTSMDLSDYQVRVELNTSNFDFTHIQQDCSDIRFTDTSNKVLDFWVEVCDPLNKNIVVWVKVPSIPANGETNIYLYYGSTGVLSPSNGERTFIFFDDFTDLSKWNCESSNSAECEYIQTTTVDDRSVVVFTSEQNNVQLTTVDTLSDLDNVAIEAMVRGFGDASDLDFYIGVDDDGKGYPNWGTRVGDNASGQYHAVVVDEGLGTQGNTYVQPLWLTCHIYRAGETVSSLYNGEWLSDTATGTPLTVGQIMMHIDPDSTSRGVYVDWIRVRKYVYPEPVANVGEEESGSYVIG